MLISYWNHSSIAKFERNKKLHWASMDKKDWIDNYLHDIGGAYAIKCKIKIFCMSYTQREYMQYNSPKFKIVILYLSYKCKNTNVLLYTQWIT